MKKHLVRSLLVLVGALLSSCGGGSAGVPWPGCGYWGASEGTGTFFEPADVIQLMSPTPVEMINAAGPVQCANHSVSGLQLRELLQGGPVAMAVPERGETVSVIEPFSQQLAMNPEVIIVVGAGMVDALFTDLTVAHYTALVRQTVATIRAAGKVPVLRGFNRFTVNERITPERIVRRDVFDAALRAQADALGVTFIDVGSVEFLGQADMRPDLIHAMPAYHQRIAALASVRLAQAAGLAPGKQPR